MGTVVGIATPEKTSAARAITSVVYQIASLGSQEGRPGGVERET